MSDEKNKTSMFNPAVDVPVYGTAELEQLNQQVKAANQFTLDRIQDGERRRAEQAAYEAQVFQQQQQEQESQAEATTAQQAATLSLPGVHPDDPHPSQTALAVYNAKGELDFTGQAVAKGFLGWTRRTQTEYINQVSQQMSELRGGEAKDYVKAITKQFSKVQGSKVGRELEGGLMRTTWATGGSALTGVMRSFVGIGEFFLGGSPDENTPHAEKSWARRQVDQAAEFWAAQHTEKQQNYRAEMQESMDQGNYGTMMADLIRNPTLGLTMTVESLLPAVAGGGAFKGGLMAVRAGAGYMTGSTKAAKLANALDKLQKSNSVGANIFKAGVPAGLVGGGAASYNLANDQGEMTAEQRLAALTSFAVNTIVPGVAAKYAPTLEGIIANGLRNTTGRGLAANIAAGVAGEGLSEAIASGVDATLEAAQGDRNNPNFSTANIAKNKNQIIGETLIGATLGAVAGGALGGLSSRTPNDAAQGSGESRDGVGTDPNTPSQDTSLGKTPSGTTTNNTVVEATLTETGRIEPQVTQTSMRTHAFNTMRDTLEVAQDRLQSDIFTSDDPVFDLNQIAQDANAQTTDVGILSMARDTLADIHTELQQSEDIAHRTDALVIEDTIRSLDQAIKEMPKQQSPEGVTVEGLDAQYQMLPMTFKGNPLSFMSPIDKLAYLSAGNIGNEPRNMILETVAKETGLSPEGVLEYGRMIRNDLTSLVPTDGNIVVPNSLAAFKATAASTPEHQTLLAEPDEVTRANLGENYRRRRLVSEIPPNPLQQRDPRFPNRTSTEVTPPPTMVSGDPETQGVVDIITEQVGPVQSVEDILMSAMGTAPITENPTASITNPAQNVTSLEIRQAYLDTGTVPPRYMAPRNWASKTAQKVAAAEMSGEMTIKDALYTIATAGINAPARGVLYTDYKYAGWLLDQIDAVDATDLVQQQRSELTGEPEQGVVIAEDIQQPSAVPSVYDTAVDPQPMAPDYQFEPVDYKSEYVKAIMDLTPDANDVIDLGQATLVVSELYPATRAMLEGYGYDARQMQEILQNTALVVDDVVAAFPKMNNEGAARTLINYAITRSSQVIEERAWAARTEVARTAIEKSARDLAYTRDFIAKQSNPESLAHLAVEAQKVYESARANAAEVLKQRPKAFVPTDAEAALPRNVKRTITDKVIQIEDQPLPLQALREAAQRASMDPATQRVLSDLPNAKVPDFAPYYTGMLDNATTAALAQQDLNTTVRKLYSDNGLPALHAAAALADIEATVAGRAEIALEQLAAEDLATQPQQVEHLVNLIDPNMWDMLHNAMLNEGGPQADFLTSDFWDSPEAKTRMAIFNDQVQPDPKILFDRLSDVYEMTRTMPNYARDATQAKAAMKALQTADRTLAKRLDMPPYLPAGPIPTSNPYLGSIDTALGDIVRTGDIHAALTHMEYQFGEHELIRVMQRLYTKGDLPLNIEIIPAPVVENGQTYTAFYDPATMTMKFANKAENVPYNVVHETAHALTHMMLEADAATLTADQLAAREALYSLYDEAVVNNAVVKHATNIHEFIAETFSNPDQRARLNYTSKVEGLGKLRTAWQGFTSFVRRLFGLKIGEHTALTDIMVATKVMLTPKPRATTPLGTSGATREGARILRNVAGRDIVSGVVQRRGTKSPFAVIAPDKETGTFKVSFMDGSTPARHYNTYAEATMEFQSPQDYKITQNTTSDKAVPNYDNTQLLYDNLGLSGPIARVNNFIRNTVRVKDGGLLDKALRRSVNAMRVVKIAQVDRYAFLQELQLQLQKADANGADFGKTQLDIYNITRTNEGEARADATRFTGTPERIMRDVALTLRKFKSSMDEFGDFLMALHVEERNAKWGDKAKPGFVVAPIDVTAFTYTPPNSTVELRGDAAAVAFMNYLDPAKRQAFKEVAERIHEVRRDNLFLELEAGMISYGEYVARGGIREDGTIAPNAFDYYVPLLNKDRDTSIPTQGVSGRYSKADNPLFSLLEQMTQRRFQMARNSTGNALIDILMAAPMPEFASIDTVRVIRGKEGEIELAQTFTEKERARTMFVMRDGTLQRVVFNIDTEYGRAGAAAFVKTSNPSVVTTAAAHFTSIMASLNTSASPAFMAKSYVWSLGTVLFNTQNAFDGTLSMVDAMKVSAATLKDTPKYTAMSSWFATTKRDPSPLLTIYQQVGGGINGTSFADLDTVQRRIGVSWKDWATNARSPNVSLVDITRGAVGRTVNAMNQIVNSPEDAIRFAVFKNFLEFKAGQKFADTAAGADAMQAFMQVNPELARSAIMGSKRLTGDFESKGTAAGMRAWFMFWNAGMQGGRVFAGAAATGQGAAAFGLLFLAGYGIAVSQMQDPDDEDFDGLSAYGRAYDRDQAIRVSDDVQIPIPYEARLAYAIGNVAALYSADKVSSSKAMASLVNTTRDVFVPLPYGGSGDLLYDTGLALMPTVGMPLVTGFLGMSHFSDDIDGKGIYGWNATDPSKPKYEAEPLDYEKGTYRTSRIAQQMSHALYDGVGADLSPRRIDATANAFLGGALSFGRSVTAEDYQMPNGQEPGFLNAVTKGFRPAPRSTGFEIAAEYKDLMAEVRNNQRRTRYGEAETMDIIGGSKAITEIEKFDAQIQKQMQGITYKGQNRGYYEAVLYEANRTGDADGIRGARAALDVIYKERDVLRGAALVKLREMTNREVGKR